MLIYGKDGTLISEKTIPEVRSLSNPYSPAGYCIRYNDQIYMAFRSISPPTGFTEADTNQDSYCYLFDRDGNKVAEHQLVNSTFPALATKSGRLLGLLPTNIDAFGQGNNFWDTYVYEINSPGGVPRIVGSGFSASKPASHATGTWFAFNSLEDLFVMVYSAGTLDQHTNAGGWDSFLFKFNSKLERQ
jgi:hypothetical protein